MREHLGKSAIMLALAACVATLIRTPSHAQVAPPTNTQTLSLADKHAVIAKAGEHLTANYIYPDRAADAKAKLDAALIAGEYDSVATPEELAKKLTSDLQSVTHDGHLMVFPPPAPRPAAAAPRPASQRVYAGFSHVDRLKGNIGYIKLRNFPGPAGPFGQTAMQAMTDLAGTDALIIDLRDNGGGDHAGAYYLSSFLFDSKTPVHIDSLVTRVPNTREFKTTDFYTRPVPVSYVNKPVYLLTSKRTRSAAEMFLYSLQAQNRVRIVGEVTPGSANGTAGHELPFFFSIGIPFTRVQNPVTKMNFEGTGVKPDLVVDESLAFQAAMREIVVGNSARYAALKTEVENQSGEEAFVEARLLQFRDQAQPGSADAMRGLFTGIASGKPEYTKMSDEVALMIKSDFDFFHNDMKRLGEVKAVTFVGVDTRGLDEYEVRTATFTERFGIYLGPDGKIVTARFQPPVPLPSQP
jgi:hypothetical protein